MDLDVLVYHHLKQLGVPASIKGYRYLSDAIVHAIRDPEVFGAITKRLYPAIAANNGTTASRVERDIRHAIEHVFDTTDPEVLRHYFGNTMSMRTGKLTNSQFMAGVAEYIRMEEEYD